MPSLLSKPERLAAFAPAGIGLALLVAVIEIRMDEPWSGGVLIVVAAGPALVLLALGLLAAEGDDTPRAAVTILLVAGLVLAAVALARLGETVAGTDFEERGGTLTLLLAAFTALAAVCARRSGSVACVLPAALAGVGLLLEFVNWVFDTEALDTFRVLLVVSFAVLFIAGLVVGGRRGTILVSAAGVTVLAAAYVTGFGFLFGTSVGWGWEIVTLAQGVALAAYAARRHEPGPGYLAFFVLASFATTAAGPRLLGEADSGTATLVGWPLALAAGTAAATLWAFRGATRDRGRPVPAAARNVGTDGSPT